MGGLIASHYLLNRQGDFAGAILSGAAIKTDLEPGAVQMALLRIVAALAPRTGVLKLDADGLSRDPDVVKSYIEDPLVFHGKMSARLVRELFNAMDSLKTAAVNIKLPMLILHGDADSLTSPDGSRFMHQHVASLDNTLKIYPGLYHEIFNEPERMSVWADLLAWCDARIPSNERPPQQ
jgi:alpha-beta hydrolase superfamily lysophospholipase